MIAVPLALLLALLAWGAAATEAFVLIRPAAAVLILWLVAGCRRHGLTALLAPLPLLSLQAMILYSLIPWLGADLHAHYMPNSHSQPVTYLGSLAEALVIGFALLAAATARAVPVAAPSPVSGPEGFLTRRGELVLAGLALTCVTAFAASRAGRLDGVWGQLRDGLAPVLMTSFALLHVHMLGRPARHARFALAALGLAVFLMLLGVGKPVVYSVAAAVLLWVLVSPLPLRRRVGVVVLLFIGGMAALSSMAFLRDKGAAHRFERYWDEPVRGLVEKVVDRQLDTGWCFGNVLAQHLTSGEPRAAGYFLAGLVPRAIWPDKPSLSVGHDLGVRYCGKDPIWKHSASITLLGEPVLRAGVPGLVTAIIVCLSGLLAVAWLGRRLGPVGLGMWIGLAPWLVDFDQTFAMYVANGVKCLLYAAPVLILAHFFRRREDAACAA